MGDGSELLGAAWSSNGLLRSSRPSNALFLCVSSGEVETVCDSRKCDGTAGACVAVLMEGFREEDAEPGEVGLREVISGDPMNFLHGEY